MEHEVVIVVADVGADGDMLDWEVVAIDQLGAVVSRHELLLCHIRAVHAEPHKVSGLHVVRGRDRLEVLQVAD